MIIPGQGMPVDFALNLMQRFIYERKGVVINIQPPRTEKQIRLFEQMITVVFAYYNVEF